MPSKKYPSLYICMLFATAIVLSACQPNTSSVASRDSVAAYVDVINYNYDRTYQYTLSDLTQQNAPEIGGGIVHYLASGGSANCCVSLPKVWRAGLKVRLDWGEADYKQEIARHTQELEIPKYDQPGNLYLSYLPEGKVELVVSQVEPGHPNWPGSIKQTPWDYCVAQHGRKDCKEVLPKTFSVVSSRGLCTYIQRIGDDMSNCAKALRICVADYEDEEFCRSVVWDKEHEE